MSSSLGHPASKASSRSGGERFAFPRFDAARFDTTRAGSPHFLAPPLVFHRHAQLLIGLMATGYGWTLLSLAGVTIGDAPSWSAASWSGASWSGASWSGASWSAPSWSLGHHAISISGLAGLAGSWMSAAQAAGSAFVDSAMTLAGPTRQVLGGVPSLASQAAGERSALSIAVLAAVALIGVIACRLWTSGRSIPLILPVETICRLYPVGGHALDIECLDLQPAPAPPNATPRTAQPFSIPVSAPCSGTVVNVADDLAGGRVVLRRRGGGYVVLARLRRGSLLVRPGQTVEAGEHLAACDVGGDAQAGLNGAGLDGGRSAPARPLLHMRVQSGPGRWSSSRRFRLAGCVTFGNGGPQWKAATPPVAGTVMQRGVGKSSAGGAAPIAAGGATYRVEAQGARAMQFAGTADTLALRILHDAAGRVWIDETSAGATQPPSRLLMRRDADAWRITGPVAGSLTGRTASPLLRCLQLALPTLPASRLPGMWWCGWSRDQRARLPWSRLRVFASLAGEASEDMTVTTRLRSADPSLPHTIRLRFAAESGLVELQAGFADGQLRIRQTGFCPAQ